MICPTCKVTLPGSVKEGDWVTCPLSHRFQFCADEQAAIAHEAIPFSLKWLRAQQKIKEPPHDDCTHRGDELRRQQCDTCKGKVQVKIFACEIHGECSLKALKGIKCCGGCDDYRPLTPPAPDAS